MTFQIIVGDCRTALPDGLLVDAVVCDPPYHLTSIVKRFGKEGSAPAKEGTDGRFQRASRGFMGKQWDGGDVAFQAETWEAIRAHMKPGAHLLAFGGSRTFHRLAVAIEDAGFEIRDTISWLYSTGFPKSLDIGKAIDKKAGVKRDSIGKGKDRTGSLAQPNGGSTFSDDGYQWPGEFDITAPATDAAKQWDGWGTALAPAWEPILLCRNPISESSVAANVIRHGTGAINIEETRIMLGVDELDQLDRVQRTNKPGGQGLHHDPDSTGNRVTLPEPIATYKADGRWPKNVILDETSAAMLDEQAGDMTGGTYKGPTARKRNNGLGLGTDDERFGASNAPDNYGDSGGASRFFYVAKPDRSERDFGLHSHAKRTGGQLTDRTDGSAGLNSPRAGAGRTSGGRNPHPTLKPVDLMSYLIRMITPPGGTVLDPFMGSGSTGMAAIAEGAYNFVGVELDPAYAEIARTRIRAFGGLFAVEVTE